MGKQLYLALFSVACLLCVQSFPSVVKRQAGGDAVDALCAQLISENASLSYTVEMESNCVLFAQCLPEGGYTVGNCSVGLFFDPEVRRCQYANLVQCANNPCQGQGDGSMVADPRGCAAYFICQGDVAVPSSCPEGESFAGGSCGPDANCGPVEVTTVPMSPDEKCAAKGLKPIGGDGTKYMAMHAGNIEVEMECPPGTVLDQDCICNHPTVT